jgi:hypothetical protein
VICALGSACSQDRDGFGGVLPAARPADPPGRGAPRWRRPWRARYRHATGFIGCRAVGTDFLARIHDTQLVFTLILEEGYRLSPDAEMLPRACFALTAMTVFDVGLPSVPRRREYEYAPLPAVRRLHHPCFAHRAGAGSPVLRQAPRSGNRRHRAERSQACALREGRRRYPWNSSVFLCTHCLASACPAPPRLSVAPSRSCVAERDLPSRCRREAAPSLFGISAATMVHSTPRRQSWRTAHGCERSTEQPRGETP